MSAATCPEGGRKSAGAKGRPLSSPLPVLSSELLRGIKRVFPTAARLILHSSCRFDRCGRLETEEQLCAFDSHGRTLWPLRPNELGDLGVQFRDHGGGGLLIIDLP